ncbi:histone-fold-containing protein [Lophiotrema nucula]|uniref:Histone-fold-containing protein n=1 Tax=Lophiotrema nucula TaxID=690887 RepID=A0A6A5ZGI6_9PLEO|nr:histone-fold-containing protein [Lophiotrema nucula]
MSSTPPKKEGVEPGAQSPDDSEPHMDSREAQEAQAQGGYEFEVKEQDRWLPIANASVMSSPSPQSSTSPPQTTPKGSNNSASDANIRNFAPVARIMKMALPDNAKIAKEAKECMQECVSEFISFITSEASEKCQQEKRKTVNGEDILFAMTSLGFENYAEALKIYLSRYRETLLANQNKPPTGGAYAGGASGANSGANPAGSSFSQGEQHNNVLSGDTEMGENDNTAFGYPVHNGNGATDF